MWGDRVTYTPEGADKPKTLWAGLGNRAGLHSYADELISDKWRKSGARFVKKLAALPSGTEVCIMQFRNVNRSRGRWVTVQRLTL